jgi:transposase
MHRLSALEQHVEDQIISRLVKEMDKEQRREFLIQLTNRMQEGQHWQTAAAAVGIQTSQSTAYRLLQSVRKQGEVALQDGRHGHASKLRGEVRTFLQDYCLQTPLTPSSFIQTLLQERFDVQVSISQINRIRAMLGVSNHAQARKLKKTVAGPLPSEAQWEEGAGNLLLLAAAQHTGLLPALETALLPRLLKAPAPLRLAHLQPMTLRSQLLTLLFLEAVGLRRTWDLRGYTGQALALLTGRQLAYGYRHTERFLAELAKAGADEILTDVLARWATSLWKPQQRLADGLVPVFYIDGHRKAVYADHLIPRGLVGRLEKVLGCRALVLLHDQKAIPCW